jgi:hypothetical protein
MTRKTKKDENRQNPIYNFPVKFTWGTGIMESFLTEEDRHVLAKKAFSEMANRRTDFVVRFQFFNHNGVDYSLAVYEEENHLHIMCDENDALLADLTNHVGSTEIN